MPVLVERTVLLRRCVDDGSTLVREPGEVHAILFRVQLFLVPERCGANQVGGGGVSVPFQRHISAPEGQRDSALNLLASPHVKQLHRLVFSRCDEPVAAVIKVETGEALAGHVVALVDLGRLEGTL